MRWITTGWLVEGERELDDGGQRRDRRGRRELTSKCSSRRGGERDLSTSTNRSTSTVGVNVSQTSDVDGDWMMKVGLWRRSVDPIETATDVCRCWGTAATIGGRV